MIITLFIHEYLEIDLQPHNLQIIIYYLQFFIHKNLFNVFQLNLDQLFFNQLLNDNPCALAAIGSKLVEVIPGRVFISRK